jgi:hypothetical protein
MKDNCQVKNPPQIAKIKLSISNGSSSVSKKRRAPDSPDNTAIKSTKSKLSLSAASKLTKVLDTTCGVRDSTSKDACHRSLTCKVHSESMKRGVQGRTMPYDALKSEHQQSAMLKKASKCTIILTVQ